jgi:hypothetical protein
MIYCFFLLMYDLLDNKEARGTYVFFI